MQGEVGREIDKFWENHKIKSHETQGKVAICDENIQISRKKEKH